MKYLVFNENEECIRFYDGDELDYTEIIERRKKGEHWCKINFDVQRDSVPFWTVDSNGVPYLKEKEYLEHKEKVNKAKQKRYVAGKMRDEVPRFIKATYDAICSGELKGIRELYQEVAKHETEYKPL